MSIALTMGLLAGGSALAKGIGGIIGNRRQSSALKKQQRFLEQDAARTMEMYQDQGNEHVRSGETTLSGQRATGQKFGHSAGNAEIDLEGGQADTQGMTSLQAVAQTDANNIGRDYSRILATGRQEADRILNQASQMKDQRKGLDKMLPFQIGSSIMDIGTSFASGGLAFNPKFLQGGGIGTTNATNQMQRVNDPFQGMG